MMFRSDSCHIIWAIELRSDGLNRIRQTDSKSDKLIRESNPILTSWILMHLKLEKCMYLQHLWYGLDNDEGGWRDDSSLENGESRNILWFYVHEGSTIYILLVPFEEKTS
ncbi:MAG: hypothetical protein ACFFEF_04340 [Candidatus Thorarchaeota archaeon]